MGSSPRNLTFLIPLFYFLIFTNPQNYNDCLPIFIYELNNPIFPSHNNKHFHRCIKTPNFLVHITDFVKSTCMNLTNILEWEWLLECQ
jgi:hypothetical protein